jgi:hypothetical protein
MSHMKSIFGLLLLTALLGLAPLAQASTVLEVNIAGSSAMWQSQALGAWSLACPHYPTCPAPIHGIAAGHWSQNANNTNLVDNRISNTDAGAIWLVWTSGATKVWAYTKVDSVVGDRCFFAKPACSAQVTTWTGLDQAIGTNLWGADSTPPAAVQAFFNGAGTAVNVAATDIRPEDAAFVVCRVNSPLGNGSFGTDGTDGLGYNNSPGLTSGLCPGVFGSPSGLASTAYYEGTAIQGAYPGSPSQANVVSFNISGSDPITGTAIPAFSVVEVGATPIVFIDQRASALATLTNATDLQLQQAFSGNNCDASALGLASGGINIFLREPLSGTMNTTEATVFRKPDVYPGSTLGISQEANVNAPSNNPLNGQSGTCLSGAGARYRAIGTGQEVKSVANSAAKFGGRDGIGYTFFSYGNVSSIANLPSQGYIQLDGVDPIFASYTGGDPGQPATATNPSPGSAGTLPGSANLPTTCSSTFPCPESDIWTGGLSFPNVRNGSYKAWSIVRLVGTTGSTSLAQAKDLSVAGNKLNVTSVPDYIPFAATSGDPGLKLIRSHYQQYDGAGNFLGAAPHNLGTTTEAGGDMGGCIHSKTGAGSTTTGLVNNSPLSSACVTRPVTP